ncbi:unnamed protein product, partial [Owenia fusiformis]
VRHNKCTYELTLAPSEDCRKYDIFTKTGQPSDKLLKTLHQEGLKDLEIKIARMIDGLQIKTLRRIRGVEMKVTEVIKKLDDKMNIMGDEGHKEEVAMEVNTEKCPNGYITVANWESCYAFGLFNASWNEAKQYCGAMGANLVAMETTREFYLLSFLIRNKAELDDMKGWWTAGQFDGQDRQWMWSTNHNNKPFAFFKWGAGEPQAEKVQQCMLLYGSDDMLWHDTPCTERLNFVCEYNITDK